MGFQIELVIFSYKDFYYIDASIKCYLIYFLFYLLVHFAENVSYQR